MQSNNRFSRAVIVVWISFLLALSSLSCGSGDEGGVRVELAPAKVRWVTWDGGSQAENLLIEQFREQYPDVEFERTQLNSEVRVMLDTQPPSDLFNMNVEYDFAEMIRKNQLSDLTELWVETGLTEQVPISLQRMGEQDGKQYYIPFGFGWSGFYYNKAIFAQYNLQPPQTWDEFLQLSETLLINGEIPLSIPGNDAWTNQNWFTYLNLRLNGLEFHRDLMRGKESFEDARVRNVIETWKSLFDQGYFVEKPQFVSGMNTILALVRSEKARKLVQQQAVMGLSDAYNASQVPPVFLNELGFFPFPTIDPSQPKVEAVNLFGYIVPMGAEHTAQTLEFLRHVSKPESQAIIAQEGIFSSVTFAPVRSDSQVATIRFDQQAAREMINSSDETYPFMWLALPDETWGLMTFYFDQFVRERDVDKFVANLEKARQAGLKKGLFGGE